MIGAMSVDIVPIVIERGTSAFAKKARTFEVTPLGTEPIRIIPAVALILYANLAKFPEAFKIFGWIMLITSLVLYLVPRKIHHQFSMKSADMLKPIYFQLISPFAFLIGGLIIYNVL